MKGSVNKSYYFGLARQITFDPNLKPDVTNRTKSNVRLIEFNRTLSDSITILGSIEFGNRTQSNSHKKKNDQSNTIER